MAAATAREPFNLEATAAEVLSLLGTGRQIEPLSQAFEGFDLAAAYAVGEAIRQLRVARGERPLGRKIGFTNRLMWDAYRVRAPIWAPVYDTTTFELAEVRGPVALAGFPEPKIEPEIVFALARTPERGMDEAALLHCIDWVALGFELVQSIYPGWNFAAADTVAGYGLHAHLYIGERHNPNRAFERWLADLATFEVELTCNDVAVARGGGAHVLGGPLTALRHLNDLADADPPAPPLLAGEIITTGTLTLAASVAATEHWVAQVQGIGLGSVALSLQ